MRMTAAASAFERPRNSRPGLQIEPGAACAAADAGTPDWGTVHADAAAAAAAAAEAEAVLCAEARGSWRWTAGGGRGKCCAWRC